MSILIILIPVSVLLVAMAIWAFLWAVDNGQFDDLDTPSLNVLFDDARDAARDDESVAARADPSETRP